MSNSLLLTSSIKSRDAHGKAVGFRFHPSPQNHTSQPSPTTPVLSVWAGFTAAIPGLQPDPDLGVVTSMVRAALEEDTLPHARFRMLHPDKRDWSAADHHVLFLVAVISDSLLEELWDKREWKNHLVRIVQAVYEVLVYMKTVQDMGNVENVEEGLKGYLLLIGNRGYAC